MKLLLLLPNKCRLAGYVLLPLALLWLVSAYVFNHPLFAFLSFNGPARDGLTDPDFLFSKGFRTDFNGELSLLCTFISLFMIAFSREREEDEYVSSIRLRALQISVYANYLVLAVSSIFIYGLSFLYVMELNLFTILIIFIIVFNFNLRIRPRLSK